MINVPKYLYCYICNGAREDKQAFTFITVKGVDKFRICFSCRDKLINVLCIQCPEQVELAMRIVPYFQLNTNENSKDPTRSD